MGKKIGNIAKDNDYFSFASDIHQSSTSEQFLICAELEDGRENRKHGRLLWTTEALRLTLIRVSMSET